MRSRALVTVLLTLAVLAAWLDGLFLRWVQVEFQFGDTADRGDYLVAAGSCLAMALLLFVGMLALFAYRPPGWLLVATAVGVGTQLALSITSYHRAQGLDDDGVPQTFGHGFLEALLFPAAYPLAVVIVIAIAIGVRRARRARDSSSPAPR